MDPNAVASDFCLPFLPRRLKPTFCSTGGAASARLSFCRPLAAYRPAATEAVDMVDAHRRLATVKGVSAGLPVRDVSQDRWLAGLALFRQPGHTGGWPVENCVVTMT